MTHAALVLTQILGNTPAPSINGEKMSPPPMPNKPEPMPATAAISENCASTPYEPLALPGKKGSSWCTLYLIRSTSSRLHSCGKRTRKKNTVSHTDSAVGKATHS